MFGYIIAMVIIAGMLLSNAVDIVSHKHRIERLEAQVQLLTEKAK